MTHVLEVAYSLNKIDAVAWREACGLFRIPVDGGHDQYQSSEYIYALARAVPYDETLLPSDAIQSHEAIMYLPIFETLHHRMSLQQQIISHEKNLDVIKMSVAPELRISLEALHEQLTLLLRWMIYPCATTSETVQRRLAYLSSGCAAEAAAVCAIYKLSHEVIITRLCEAMKRTSAFEEDFGPVTDAIYWLKESVPVEQLGVGDLASSAHVAVVVRARDAVATLCCALDSVFRRLRSLHDLFW